MTSQTRATNIALFQDGDVPTGSNYRDVIDSYVSLIDTTAQALTSNLTVPTLIPTIISAGAVFADSIAVSGAAQFNTVVSAQAGLVVNGAARFNTRVSAQAGVNVSGSVLITGITSAAAVFADSLTVDGLLTLNAVTTAEAGATAAYIQINVAGTLRSIRVFATS